MFSDYTPKPQHILIPALIVVLAAVVTGFFPSWQMGVAFGIIAIICLATGVSIAVSIAVEKYSQYWVNVGRDIDKLQKTPPQLWGAVGFQVPPSSIRIQEDVTEEEENIYLSIRNAKVSLSPTESQIFADGILSGAKSLSEGDWKNTQLGQTKVREVKHEMLKLKMIAKKNDNNVLSGFVLTKKGFLFLYQYASDWVKADIRVSVVDSPNPTTLLEASLPPKL